MKKMKIFYSVFLSMAAGISFGSLAAADPIADSSQLHPYLQLNTKVLDCDLEGLKNPTSIRIQFEGPRNEWNVWVLINGKATLPVYKMDSVQVFPLESWQNEYLIQLSVPGAPSLHADLYVTVDLYGRGRSGTLKTPKANYSVVQCKPLTRN